MEIALTVMLAFVGIASCAVVMIRMWGPEALAFRKGLGGIRSSSQAGQATASVGMFLMSSPSSRSA